MTGLESLIKKIDLDLLKIETHLEISRIKIDIGIKKMVRNLNKCPLI